MKKEIPYFNLRAHDPTVFHIRPLRTFIDPEDVNEVPHRHNFQEILWVKSGHGRHVVDGEELAITPNTCYLIAKGQVHHFLYGEALVGILIRFKDEFLFDASAKTSWNYQISLFNHITNVDTLPLNPADYVEYDQLLSLMMIEHERSDIFANNEMLRHLLLVLLLKLERIRHQQRQGPVGSKEPQTAVFESFLQLLEENYRQTHAVADYAAALGVTPRQLSRILQRFVGRNTKQLIDERLVLDAKRYLRHTNYSIKEMAFLLGYKDPSYFSRVFKRSTGLTPQTFRG